MNAVKWEKINKIFHAALKIETGERTEFIQKQSIGDEEITAEVQKLIAAHEEADSFIQKPVAENAFQLLSNENTETVLSEKTVPNKIGRFEIIKKIGKGGMGEVFLARDESLERDVAIKILPKDFTADSSRVSRFIREAKAASALNHPNILTIYEIGEADGANFMASEFVKGKTLTEVINQEKPTLSNILKISAQILSALQAAHEAGIVHRDIKPDNIMVRNDGIVKVLDFGLAKLLEKAVSNNQQTTAAGLIMGTPNYMSPEQARGKDIDYQTDIFSFGIVLYQMLAGKLPFQGDSMNDTIAAILTKEPEPLENVAPELRKIVEKCLQKDKQNRYQTAKNLRQDLEEAQKISDLQNLLEKSSVPNKEEQKTQVLRATTADDFLPIVTKETQVKSYKSYVLLTLLSLFVLTFGYFGYKYFSPSKQIDSIAVIPFVNKTNNAEMEYLSDGMTETLISSLSKIPNLNVKARSSVFRYKGKETDFKKIAEELNVKAILNGDVIQRGDQLILNLELFDTETENRIWGNTYTKSQADVVNLQNEIARDVSENLKLKLSGADTAKIENNYTANPEAYKLYLKGRFYWNKRRIADAKKSVEMFQQAIDLDPNYALGYAGLADGYALLGNLDGEPQLEVMPKAKEAAKKAISLDKNLSEAHATLGIVYANFDYDFVEAEREYKLAIEANPNNATSYFYYSQLLSRIGKSEEAIRASQKAIELEPFASYINNFYGGILHLARRYDEAETQLKRTIELDPNFPPIYLNLFSVYQMQGRYAESVEAFAKYQELLGQNSVAVSARESFAKGGWEGFLRKMPSEPDLKIYRHRFLAIFYATLGEKEKAIDELESEYKNRGSFVNGIKVFPAFDSLRNEPRFKELVKKAGIPE